MTFFNNIVYDGDLNIVKYRAGILLYNMLNLNFGANRVCYTS